MAGEKERFKVTCCRDDKNIEVSFGWSDDRELVNIMVNSINQHPCWHSPRVIDRGKIKNKCGTCEKYFEIGELSFTTLYENCESSRYSIKLICPNCGFDKFTFEKENT